MRRRRSQARFVVGLAAVFLVTTWVCLLIWAVVPAAILQWESIALTSDSMAPGLREGDVVVASPENTYDLGVGTVVVFRDEFGLVTHRIVAVSPDGNYVTKGDANPRPDSTPVAPDGIIGVGRIRVPFVALPLTWFQNEEWAKLGLWLAIAALALWLSSWVDGGRWYRGRHRELPIPREVAPSARSAAVSIALGLVALALVGSPARAAFSDTTDSQSNSLEAAGSFGVVLYLHNNPTPPVGDTSSQAVLPLDATSPSASTLYNYDDDRDGDPGLKLAKGSGLSETDPSKHQIWSMAGPVDLDGTAALTLWSAIKDFDTSKQGIVLAAVLDCDSGGGGCSTIASGSLDVDPWSGGSSTWVSRTIDLGSVTHTIASNRTLRVKVVVDGSSGDDMWFAYDTTAYDSVLTVGP